jgi:hypothetical protein
MLVAVREFPHEAEEASVAYIHLFATSLGVTAGERVITAPFDPMVAVPDCAVTVGLGSVVA